MPVDPKAPIWERLEGESSKAFAAFCLYRNLGADRSVEKAYRLHRLDANKGAEDKQKTGSAESTGKRRQASGVFNEWASKYRWLERAAAYDDEQERLKLKAFEAERQKMNQRQAALGQHMQRIALSALLHKPIEEVWEMKPLEISTFVKEGIRAERLARGEPTVTTEAKVTHSIGKDDPLKKVPLEKLEELERMLASVLEPQDDGSGAPAEQADGSDLPD